MDRVAEVGAARGRGGELRVPAVLAAADPAEAKELGRTVRGYDDVAWQAAAFDIVVRGNHAKFAQHEDLAGFLTGTGDAVLVEASPYDAIWGIGLRATDPAAATPSTWRGTNLLGFALMEVRDRLVP